MLMCDRKNLLSGNILRTSCTVWCSFLLSEVVSVSCSSFLSSWWLASLCILSLLGSLNTLFAVNALFIRVLSLIRTKCTTLGNLCLMYHLYILIKNWKYFSSNSTNPFFLLTHMNLPCEPFYTFGLAWVLFSVKLQDSPFVTNKPKFSVALSDACNQWWSYLISIDILFVDIV